MSRAYDEIETDPTYKVGYKINNKGIEHKEGRLTNYEDSIIGLKQSHPILFSIGFKFFIKFWMHSDNRKPH